nr:hypothetical protein [Lachnospiraceae bacterium]
VLNYRKPAFWIILIAIIACIVLAVCLMTDPFSNKSLSGKLGISMDMAVAGHNHSSETEGHFVALDYDVLQVSKTANKTTVYAWVMYEEYSFDGTDVKEEAGSHIPTVITFDTSSEDSDKSTYDVIEYWEPRDGSYYADDIRAKFPWSIRREAFDVSGAAQQHENCLRAAREYFDVGQSVEENGSEKYYLTIGADGVKSIEITAPYFSGGCENADGSLYRKGESIWLGALDGRKDLRGVTITALDEKGAVLWTASVPDTEANKGFTRLTQDDWTVTNLGVTSAESTDRPIDLETLRTKYPEYFDLSTFKGLELYVWQMAPDSYSCALMLGTNRNKTWEELINLKGASLAEMRAILSTYDIPQDDVFIIPCQNPISSYLGDYWIQGEDEGDAAYAARQHAYIDWIRQKLFDTTQNGEFDFSISIVGGVDDPGSVTINIRIDVCELYLKVLEDLWYVDPGLNDGISLIGIDLSELSHLTELEKETVMHEFASKHNLSYIAGTWEELCEQGYIDKDNLYWEDGLFFSIKTNEDAEWNHPYIKDGESVPKITFFEAQKWRSGLGAYFFNQCTAQKNADGKWSYTVGMEAIS